MSERAAITRLRREYSNIQAEKIPHIVARPTEKDLLVWHYVLHDLPTSSPYTGGVYWGKLVFPRGYPLQPPAIYMLTPSGRFEINMRLCLSMSDFHPESWNPSWRIESILIGLVSFMLDPNEPRTTGGVHAPVAKRRELAKASFDSNRGHAEFRELFPEFCDETKLHPAGGFFLQELPPVEALRALAATPNPMRCAGDEAAGADGAGNPDAAGGRGGLPATLVALSLLVLVVSGFSLYVMGKSDTGESR